MKVQLRGGAGAVLFATFALSCGSQLADVGQLPCDGVCGSDTKCNEASGVCEPIVSTIGGNGGGQSSALTGMPCDVARVFSEKCESCHATNLKNGAPVALSTRDDLSKMSNYPKETLAQRSLDRVKDSNNPMPPAWTGMTLSPQDVAALQNWVDGNLPAGTCTVSDTPVGSGGGAGGSSGSGGGSGASGGGAAGGMSGAGGGQAGGSGGHGGGSAGGGAAGGGAAGGGSGGSGGGGSSSGAYCRACSSSAQCGGSANFCLGFSFGDYCGTDCSAGQACGANAHCVSITDSSGAVVGKNCVPLSGQTCSGTSSGSGGGGGSSGGGAGGSGGGGSSGCGTDTWANYGQSFFDNTCNSCHTHSGEFTPQSTVRSRKSTIYSYISSGSMPQGGGITSAQRTRILNYLNCNVP